MNSDGNRDTDVNDICDDINYSSYQSPRASSLSSIGNDILNDEQIGDMLRSFNNKFVDKSKSEGAQFYRDRGNTIDKTSTILREIQIKNGGSSSTCYGTYDDDDDNNGSSSVRNKHERRKQMKKRQIEMSRLYGYGIHKIGFIKGKKVVPKYDQRDYEFEPIDVDYVNKLVSECTYLCDTQSINQSIDRSIESDSMTIYELRGRLDLECHLKLTIRQTAALIDMLHQMYSSNNSVNIIVGKGASMRVNTRSFLIGLKLLASSIRESDRTRRRGELLEMKKKYESRVNALTPLRQPDEPALLNDLYNGLCKITNACKHAWKYEEKYMSKICNAYACLDGSVDWIVLKDFARENLHLKLSTSEASAIISHVDKLGTGYIPMDMFLRQLKILALGKASIFSPLQDDGSICSTHTGNRVSDSSVNGIAKVISFNSNDDDDSVSSNLTDDRTYERSISNTYSNASAASQASPVSSNITAHAKDRTRVLIPDFLISKGLPMKDALPKLKTIRVGDSANVLAAVSASFNPIMKYKQIDSRPDDKTVISSIRSYKSSYSDDTTTSIGVPAKNRHVNDDDSTVNSHITFNTTEQSYAAAHLSSASVHTKTPAAHILTSLYQVVKSTSSGASTIMTPSDPIQMIRPVHYSEKVSSVQSIRRSDVGVSVDNNVKDVDRRRWLTENFNRLPLDDKHTLLRYTKRWSLMGYVIDAMKRQRASVAMVVDKMRYHMNMMSTHVRVDDPLSDIGCWITRHVFIEQMITLHLVASERMGNTLFSSLDPRKRGAIPSFELSSLTGVLLSLPWTSAWSSAGDAATASAAQIVDALIQPIVDDFDGSLPASCVQSSFCSICCTHDAEDVMTALLSPLLTLLPTTVVLVACNDPAVKATTIRCIAKDDLLAAVAKADRLKELLECQFRESAAIASSASVK